MDTFDAAQEKRLATFQITSADIDVLKRNSDFARNKLPDLLQRLNATLSVYPEIQHALMDPAVHKVRVAHWSRVASGQFGAGFLESAEALAKAFYDNGVPGYAVAICHSTVSGAIIKELGLDQMPGSLFGRGTNDRLAQRDAINKAAWMDLEVLLETYAAAEAQAKRSAMNALASVFESKVLGIVDTVAQSSEQLKQAVETMSGTADRSTQASNAAASAAEDASQNVQTVATAAEQLAMSISEIGQQVAQSSGMTGKAVEDARRTDQVVQELADGAQRIGEVVTLINSIAGQTNLLALNATIEAARAGDAGKGFAVVASEVKNLATQTARATEDIAQQVSSIQSTTKQAVDAIQGIGRVITEVHQIAAQIAAAVEEQGAATSEISRSVQQAATGNAQVSQLMSGIREDGSETKAVAGHLTGAADGLGNQSAALRAAVDGFLGEIRAA